MKLRLRALWSWFFVASIFLGRVATGQEPAPTSWNVVLLYGGDLYLPAAITQDEAMRGAFVAGTKRSVNFYVETLHRPNLSPTDFDAEFVNYLHVKYRNNKIDLIMVGGDSALFFLERHRSELWPETPVVFFSVDEAGVAHRTLPPDFTGVTIALDPAGTLEFARRLQPEAHRVIVVTGASESDHSWLPGIQSYLSSHHPGLNATYLTNQTVAELGEDLRKLTKDTIVLYTTVLADASGKQYQPRDVASRLGEVSGAPVYGFYESMLGHGILGGRIPSLAEQGRSAGELALRVVNGERPGAIPVQLGSPARPMVDWRQLKHWRISERRLPAGTVINFRQPTLWELHRWHVMIGLGIIGLETVLIAALLVQWRRHQRAELDLHNQQAEIAHVSRLAIVGELTASIAHEINQPLGAILSNADAAEMLLEKPDPPLVEIRQILTDIRQDDLRASEVILRMRTLLRKRELAVLPLNLNEAISEVLRMIETDARRRDVMVEAELGSGLPVVPGDKVHLQQVLLNLAVNGMDAMGETPEPQRRLIIRTQLTLTGAVEVQVKDAGHGIPPNTLARLFDSYYTTKTEGMGLGLSIARSIIEAHRGRIWAENNPEGGATFRFTLPAKELALIPVRK
jgi:signal transduction histidine kinase